MRSAGEQASYVCLAEFRLNELIDRIAFSARAEYITVSVPSGPAASATATGVLPVSSCWLIWLYI